MTQVVRRLTLLGPLLAVLAGLPAHGGVCYTVHSPDNRVLYRSEVSPVDLSRRLSETLPRAFPAGSSMVFVTSDSACPPVTEVVPVPRRSGDAAAMPSSQTAAPGSDWYAPPSGIPTAQERAEPPAQGPGVYRSLQAGGSGVEGQMTPQERARYSHERWLQLQEARDARIKAAIASRERTVLTPAVATPVEPEPAPAVSQTTSYRSTYSYNRRGRRR